MTTVNVMNFVSRGRVPGVTDDLHAFNAALAALRAKALNPTPQLEIPEGRYFSSGAINIHESMRIFGVGGAFGNQNPGTTILFGPNAVSGIVLHEWRTTDDGGGYASQPSGLGDASGSIVEGLGVWGPGAQAFDGPWTNPNAKNRNFSGIWVRGSGVQLKDLATLFSSGNGVTISGTSGESGGAAGQANLWSMERVQSVYNSMDAFCIWGSDANAGNARGCSARSNGAAGFREYSFLGNTHIGHHTSNNGMGDPILSGALGGTCSHNGKTYYIRGQADGAEQEALASVTEPGTNDAVWREWQIAGSPPSWVPGQSWRICGPYVTNPNIVTANNLFIGMYREGGQAPCQSTKPALWIGGTNLAFDDSGNPGMVIHG